MRIIILSFCCLIILSCQKEYSPGPDNTTATTFDSLVGDWKYLYDYRLTATVANPDVIIDSMYGYDDYTPYSYMKINSDSTFAWYRTALKTPPTRGYGFTGKLSYQASLRGAHYWAERETMDSFTTVKTFNPAVLYLTYRIKYLSNDSLVMIMRQQPTPPGNFY
jgi:hypothetical protein